MKIHHNTMTATVRVPTSVSKIDVGALAERLIAPDSKSGEGLEV